jgi:uncharacterized membrane protein YfcA
MIVDADEPLAQAARLRSDARRCRSFACRITVELLADPIFMAVAVIGVCLLGISKGGFLGMGVMALPLMSLFVPPLQAAAIILPTAIAQDFLTLWVYRRAWSAWNLKIMLPSMCCGMVLAWLMAAQLSAVHIRLAIGLIAALFVLRHWTARRYIGTLSILFAASNVVKVPGFLTLGYLTRDNLLVGLTLVPIALLANFAGIWMVRRVSTELFYRIAYVLMFIIAVELIRGSVVDLWWGN